MTITDCCLGQDVRAFEQNTFGFSFLDVCCQEVVSTLFSTSSVQLQLIAISILVYLLSRAKSTMYTELVQTQSLAILILPGYLFISDLVEMAKHIEKPEHRNRLDFAAGSNPVCSFVLSIHTICGLGWSFKNWNLPDTSSDPGCALHRLSKSSCHVNRWYGEVLVTCQKWPMDF